ncbi:TetR family transcriptional regulator [Streptomyces sp. NBC_01498]|uniref:TetR/AcrR family transcriptional regulator n=1 Tax=Streptomyces sp. NBC_01498 TaxID=2975870 RepID=UPI002E7AB261|nr:TetR family transcriptional regulator [Streptomyces sp. NBC_01498]WTL23312.1 TetR family transcriptional regulator [Streptomyces sp. NBC_01498]
MSPTESLSGTRARLLVAARGEFAVHGMGGARVGRIAERAGVSKERIYGYFGSKEGLFAAVVSEALTEHAALLGPPSGDPGEYAGRIYDLHRSNPQLLRLMMWEALHYDGDGLPNEQPRGARYREMVGTLSETLGSGSDGGSGSASDGGSGSDGAAASTLLALIGLAVLPTAFPQIARLILGPAADDDTELRSHIVRLARRMVAGPDVPTSS